MLRGIYTSASGMLVEALKTDAVANNLANAATHGFKRQVPVVRSFPQLLLHRINDPPPGGAGDPRPPVGRLGTGAALEEFVLQLTPGAFTYTGRPLDLALDGPGFFGVQTPEGGVAYTRDGNVHVDAAGYLAGHHGGRFLGSAGPIFVGTSAPVVDDEGRVWLDGVAVDRLLVVGFAEPRALERRGENLLVPTEGSGPPEPAAGTRVRSGHLEEANVNVVREMVDLIAIQRAYEANQRSLTAQDETLGRLIGEASARI